MSTLMHGAHHDAPTHTSDLGPVFESRWVLPLLCAAQFLLVLDVTVVNVAVPALRAALGLTAGDAQWAVTAYAVPFGALLLAGGRAGDRWGRRRVLVAGLAVFAVGSAVAAATGSVAGLLGGRALQGVGAAAVSPSALALLVTVFPSGPAHRRAMAAWGGVGASGAAAGVLLGGVLTSAFGWRSVFLIGVPVATALAVAATRLLPAAAPARPRRLDTLGAVLAMAAAGAGLLGAARAATLGFAAPQVWGSLVAAVLALGLLVRRLRHAADPLVQPAILARRTVLTGMTLMGVAAGSLVTTFYLTSLLLQDGYGHSPVRTGLEFLPAALATVVGARGGAHALARWGSRPVGAAGLTLAVGGAGLLAFADPTRPWAAAVLPGFVLLALGLGATFVVAGTTTMSHIGPGEAGTLAGLSTTAHELGAGFVLAVVVAIAAGDGGELFPDAPHGAYLALAGVAVLGALAAVVGLRRGEGKGGGAAFTH
jgi:MFS family permease